MVASLAAPLRARSATPYSPSSAAVATTSARSSPTSGHFGPLSSPDSSRRSARQNATRLRLRQPEGVIQGQLFTTAYFADKPSRQVGAVFPPTQVSLSELLGSPREIYSDNCEAIINSEL